MKRPTLAGTLLLGLIVSLVAPGAVAADIALRGAQSCAVWAKARAQNDARYEIAWLTGYFSGLAIGTDVNFWGTKGRDLLETEVAWKWIDTYCAEHPKKNVIHAAEQLFVERYGVVSRPPSDNVTK
jgi:hypothetical protein